MTMVYLLLGLWALQSVFVTVWGDGCNTTEVSDAPVVNMCGQSDVVMGRVYISVTTDTMGTNIWCSCTLRPKTSGLQTTSVLYLKSNDSLVTKCHLSLIQIDPFEGMPTSNVQNFTCTTPLDSNLITRYTTSDVTVTLTRPDTSVGVSYCLLLQPYRYIDYDMLLSCQSGTTSTSPTASSTPLPTTTNSLSSPSSTTPSSTSPTTTSLMTSSISITSSATSPVTSVSSGYSVSTGSATTVGSDNSTPQGQDFSVAAVAGGVSGALVLLVVVIIVVVVVCKRRQGKKKPSRPAVDNAHENPEYAAEEPVSSTTSRPHPRTSSAIEAPSSSKTRALDDMIPAFSSPYELEDELAQGDGTISMNPAAGTAMMNLDANGTQPANPAANLYAVVNKPKGRQLQKPPPEKPPMPEDVRAAPTGDEYAVVDKSRKKGGNAKKKSSLPSSEATPPPVPPSPGLQYADLEEVRGEGRRPAPPRPPANMATGTEYAEIDHQATARFSTET